MNPFVKTDLRSRSKERIRFLKCGAGRIGNPISQVPREQKQSACNQSDWTNISKTSEKCHEHCRFSWFSARNLCLGYGCGLAFASRRFPDSVGDPRDVTNTSPAQVELRICQITEWSCLMTWGPRWDHLTTVSTWAHLVGTWICNICRWAHPASGVLEIVLASSQTLFCSKSHCLLSRKRGAQGRKGSHFQSNRKRIILLQHGASCDGILLYRWQKK